ncbi:MAG: hypothetical protein NE328_14300 [Lentisphaeraceae bacterium]|nr:hypothetical protein [Lentisphaeraceae bacterium]
MTSEELLKAVMRAHDPDGIWTSINFMKIRLRICGRILMTKLKNPSVRELDIEVSTSKPWIKINSFPDQNSYGVLDGYQARIISKNTESCRTFNYPYKYKFLWDDLDLLFFLGYALWNYTTTPYIFQMPGFSIEKLSDLNGEHRLSVHFPNDIPSHCQQQIFYFDEKYLQTRLDYTAEVFWGSARGRHYCEKVKDFGGLKVATNRYVYPFNLNFCKVMEGWVDDVELIYK